MAFGIFSSGDLIQSGWIAEFRTRVKYGIYIMLNRECSLIFKQTSWVVQIDKGTTCNYLTENVNYFEIKIICMSIKCYFSEYFYMLKIFKRKYQTPWWLNFIMWSATCSLFAKHYNYSENQSDLMYHQVSEIKLDHLPKLSSHSNLNWIKRTSCHTTRTGLRL